MSKRILNAGCVIITAILGGSFIPPVAAQDYVIAGVYGTRNAYRGSTAWVEIGAGWYDSFDFTVDPVSNTITAPGHNFTTGALVRVFSDQTLPYPLSRDRWVYTCDVSGDTFRLANYESSSCASTKIDIKDAGAGRLRIGKKRNANFVLIDTAIEGLPAGVAAEIFCGSSRCPVWGSKAPGRVYNNAGFYGMYLKLKISSAAALGPANMTVSVEPIGAPVQKVSIPLHIHELVPTRLASAASMAQTAGPPIPGLAKWESSMRTLAAKWCKLPNPTELMGFGVEYQVWTYDGANVYYQVADYLQDTAWRACGTNIAKQYSNYVIQNKGKIPGHRVFARGLAQAYRLTGVESYREAVKYLALSGLYSGFGSVRDDGIRPTAYALDAMVTYEKLTGNRAPNLVHLADMILGMFDQLFVSNTYVYQQIFMDGMGMRALIDYWSLTRDPRVPVAIKTALDWIWENAWLKDTNKLVTNPDPLGPKCDWGCRTAGMDLINLMVPAYAWYWSVTGDRTYLERGDTIFSHALDNDISYSGKVFTQNYTWSMDYVRWRTAARPAR